MARLLMVRCDHCGEQVEEKDAMMHLLAVAIPDDQEFQLQADLCESCREWLLSEIKSWMRVRIPKRSGRKPAYVNTRRDDSEVLPEHQERYERALEDSEHGYTRPIPLLPRREDDSVRTGS